MCVAQDFERPSFQETPPALNFWMVFQLQETDEAQMRSWGEDRLRSVAKLDFTTYPIRLFRWKDEDLPKAMPFLVSDGSILTWNCHFNL